jgi:3'-5' exonuclease
VLDTYFVFLRVQVLMGKLTLEQEKSLTDAAKQLIQSQADSHPAYRSYLEQWGDWSDPFANLSGPARPAGKESATKATVRA